MYHVQQGNMTKARDIADIASNLSANAGKAVVVADNGSELTFGDAGSSDLYGFEKYIKKFRYIQFEFNGCNIDSKTFFQDFWYFFKKNNFRLYRLTPSGPLLIKKYTEEDEYFGMSNFIAQNTKFLT